MKTEFSFLERITSSRISDPALRDEVQFWLDRGFLPISKWLESPFENPRGEGFLLKKGDFVKESKNVLSKRGFKKTGYPLWLESLNGGVSVSIGLSKTGATRGYTSVGFMKEES